MSGHSEAVCGLLDVGGVQGWVFAHIICVTDGAVGLVAGSAKEYWEVWVRTATKASPDALGGD